MRFGNMAAALRTKVDETGIIPTYCTCEKIDGYVLASRNYSAIYLKIIAGFWMASIGLIFRFIAVSIID